MNTKQVMCAVLAICCGAGFCGCGKPLSEPDPADFSGMLTELTTEAPPQETTTTADPYLSRTADTRSGGKLIHGVPHISQIDSYLTACETLSAVELLQYYGIEISPEEFIDLYLPVTDYPQWQASDNQLHGESPWEYFLGDPMAADAYGCYNTVIAAALNSVTDGLAIQLDKVPLEELCRTYIDKGQPLIIWATMQMAETFDGNSWILPNGDKYTFTCPEHALLLIGYDDEYYYFSDSLQEEEITAYSKESVEKAYAAMYSMAIGIRSEPEVLQAAAICIQKDLEADEALPVEEPEDLNAAA